MRGDSWLLRSLRHHGHLTALVLLTTCLLHHNPDYSCLPRPRRSFCRTLSRGAEAESAGDAEAEGDGCMPVSSICSARSTRAPVSSNSKSKSPADVSSGSESGSSSCAVTVGRAFKSSIARSSMSGASSVHGRRVGVGKLGLTVGGGSESAGRQRLPVAMLT